MFDIGLSELLLIALIGLLVLGPKRLPEVARTAGYWVGRLRAWIANVKQDLDREINSAELAEFRRLKSELEETRRMIEESTQRTLAQVSQGLDAGATPAQSSPTPAQLPAEHASNPTPSRRKRKRAKFKRAATRAKKHVRRRPTR